MNAVWRRRLEELLEEPAGLDRALTSYDAPRGNPRFLEAIAKLFKDSFGWNIGPENVAITSRRPDRVLLPLQPARREMPDGRRKKILLPLVPEYIGYSNQGASTDLFRAFPPIIEKPARMSSSMASISKSSKSPMTSRDLRFPPDQSHRQCPHRRGGRAPFRSRKAHNIPLIIDNAYGAPFPGIIFTEAKPYLGRARRPHLQPLENRPARHPHRHRHRAAADHPRARFDECHRRPRESEHRPADRSAPRRVRRDPPPFAASRASFLQQKSRLAVAAAHEASARIFHGRSIAARALCSSGCGSPACRSPRRNSTNASKTWRPRHSRPLLLLRPRRPQLASPARMPPHQLRHGRAHRQGWAKGHRGRGEGVLEMIRTRE
jgi:hypothetical protein